MDLRLAPSVGTGRVVHARHAPLAHRFVYPLAFVRVPLSAWAGLRVPLLGVDRANVFSLRRADHGARDGSDPARWLKAILQARGLAAAADGEVVLQTFPRLFGYVFNPVSFWFCHDAPGRLRAVIAEVNNTFGEHHAYVVAHPDARPITAADEFEVAKAFYVSPFFPVAGSYRFRFVLSEARSTVCIDYEEDGRPMLSTRLSAPLEPLTGRALGRWLLRFPAMTVGVMWRIHVQAFQLWRKRAPFFRKPEPPLERIS